MQVTRALGPHNIHKARPSRSARGSSPRLPSDPNAFVATATNALAQAEAVWLNNMSAQLKGAASLLNKANTNTYAGGRINSIPDYSFCVELGTHANQTREYNVIKMDRSNRDPTQKIIIQIDRNGNGAEYLKRFPFHRLMSIVGGLIDSTHGSGNSGSFIQNCPAWSRMCQVLAREVRMDVAVNAWGNYSLTAEGEFGDTHVRTGNSFVDATTLKTALHELVKLSLLPHIFGIGVGEERRQISLSFIDPARGTQVFFGGDARQTLNIPAPIEQKEVRQVAPTSEAIAPHREAAAKLREFISRVRAQYCAGMDVEK